MSRAACACARRPRAAALLLGVSLGLLLPRPGVAQATPAPAAPPPAGTLLGYRTASGRSLPLLQHQPYQAARRLWFIGFVSTMVGLGLSATGATVLMAGGIPEGTYTLQGRERVLLAGGLLTAVGGAVAIAGGSLWFLGYRDLRQLERGLPAADGVLTPALALSF